MGLAEDGGLLIPDEIPSIKQSLPRWVGLEYAELAYNLIKEFTDDLAPVELKTITKLSYHTQFNPQPVVIKQYGSLFIAELYHGPTLAFKDLALQFIGNLFARIPSVVDQGLNILAATSGDTGSAAIYGFKGKKYINVFVMHPYKRISKLQELQMTTVLDPNIHNIAIEGDFDDCQRILKSVSADLDFKHRYRIGAVNSVNWARIVAQIVYYFWITLKIITTTKSQTVQFCVPTGNFGNILAGWYARHMGCPIEKLILATNANDILARFFQSGTYSRHPLQTTLAPAMDIQVASNFERYLYYRLQGDTGEINRLMRAFAQIGSFSIPGKDPLFDSYSCDETTILDTIREFYNHYEYLLDPHTATAAAAAKNCASPGIPTIILATAHPAKFPEAIHQALQGVDYNPPTHPYLERLSSLPTRLTTLPADDKTVKEFIAQTLTSR